MQQNDILAVHMPSDTEALDSQRPTVSTFCEVWLFRKTLRADWLQPIFAHDMQHHLRYIAGLSREKFICCCIIVLAVK